MAVEFLNIQDLLTVDIIHSSMMHVGRGRQHPLHIEYVHIGACLAFIQDTLTEALLSHPRIKMDRKIALIKALGKVIWIQNDLFAKWYVRDGDEFAQDMEQHEIEQEGYMDGHKVLEDIDEVEESPATCPFSGVPIRSKAQKPPAASTGEPAESSGASS